MTKETNNPNEWFKFRPLVIATKHKKEEVIAPIISLALGCECFTLPELDTDLLGTFTGEIERANDPLTTARNKCLMAMELANCSLAIASEGSFGPHPSMGFVNADDELILFMDKKNGLEIWARELSLDTNFNGQQVSNFQELLLFAEQTKFPSHGLIIRKAEKDSTDIIKGITDIHHLKSAFDQLQASNKNIFVETDMRAMNNPSRMNVIKTVTKKLIQKIQSTCPSCHYPGFGVTSVQPGLPCECCGFPTKSTLSYNYTCEACHHRETKPFPHGKIKEEPIYCDKCNP
jgi:hypothetical protein